MASTSNRLTRRSLGTSLALPGLALPGLALPTLAQSTSPAVLEVKQTLGKPTLHLRGKPIQASFYALTDCPGGRWSYDEGPAQSIGFFVEMGFRLFQLDLFLEDCWTAPNRFSLEPARKQLAGMLKLCPDCAVVLRWHLNAPKWWRDAHPDELVRYFNGDYETQDRTVPIRYIQDDLKRLSRNSLASELWMREAEAKTIQLLRGLAALPEGRALAGLQVACGVYGEWHYWGFMRNEPDASAPMQAYFDRWRKAKDKPAIPVPGMAERAALDDGIFRDPAKREGVIDYYRCQQELIVDRITRLCEVAKKNWPRPLLTGTFYGYFFSMFNRQVTGGHLELPKLLASPHVDYLSAPQAYGELFRDMGGSGITRALIESVRLHGKLFLDEMDQTPSWTWQNNVDIAFRLKDVESDYAILRRNVLESYTRGAGLWYYDFGPANLSGWWNDTRLLKEIKSLKATLDRYHAKPYAAAGDVLAVFDTEVFYYTGSTPGSDGLTDPLAVNQFISQLWRSGLAVETIHLADLDKVDLSRFRVVAFANTWLLRPAQRRFIRERVMADGRHVVFTGFPGYCDGQSLNKAHSRELTSLLDSPQLSREGNIWCQAKPPISPQDWRRIAKAAGAHVYFESNDVLHAGGGLLLLHSKEGGKKELRLRNGRVLALTMPARSSWIFDAVTGERLA
ncbi:MAG: hypothetical protein NW208_11020 [Bryobacter sp.]|nr:hypothetical protein [Bryobacter sp.]